jgi:alpha-ribazole phosphatase
MLLHLIRHPQPLVDAGICYGSSDLPVAPEHLAACIQTLQVELAQAGACPIYSSPLQRCSALAEGLAARLNTRVDYDARLQEMHFGAWELQAWDDIARSEIDAWSADLLYFRPGGGESLWQVAQRVRAFLTALLQTGHEHVILITHAGVIRIVLAYRDWQSSHSTLSPAPDDALAHIALQAASAPHAIAYGALLPVQLK